MGEVFSIKFLYILTGVLLLISLLIDRKKTAKALRIALKKFLKILPSFAIMIILVSIVLYIVPDTLISKYLGGSNTYVGMMLAITFGSISFMPGFIVFPLSGLLLEKGVSYMVISAFTTTLMMVGILTFPVEKEYLGTRVAIVRNLLSLGIAIVVAVATGIFFGEVF